MANTHATLAPFDSLGPKKFGELVRMHKQGKMNCEEYLAQHKVLLGRSMDRQVVIYLDTLVWIRLRETVLGKGSTEEQMLLDCLRRIVQQRKGLCVSHLHSLLELGRQTETSLRVTAGLLQELTEGVVLVSPDELRAWECAQFVHEVIGCPAPAAYEIWTKVGFSHRSNLPYEYLSPTVPQALRDTAMKLTIDQLWNADFAQVFEAFNWDTKSKLCFDIDKDVIGTLESIRKSNRSSERTFQAERVPAFSVFVDENLRPLFTEVLRCHRIFNSESLSRVCEAAKRGFQKNELGRRLGLSRLMVDLYVRTVTADKPLSSNDYVDWAHAGAALPNCDVFVTERHLAHQLTRELQADKAYNCDVVCGAGAAAKLLTERLSV